MDCCTEQDLWIPLKNLIVMGGLREGLVSCTTQHHTIWVERFVGIWDRGKCNEIVAYLYQNSQATRPRPRLVLEFGYGKDKYHSVGSQILIGKRWNSPPTRGTARWVQKRKPMLLAAYEKMWT